MSKPVADERCELIMADKISQTKIRTFYDLPTTEDRINYSNEQIVRKGGRVVNRTGETRIKYGLKIITGIEDYGDKGKRVPVSSDLNSPNYNPAWKVFLRTYRADILSLLAVHVFEASVTTVDPEEEEAEAAEDAPAADAGGKEGAEDKNENPL